MPMFEYKCTECGSKFEELVAESNAIVACPKCQSQKVERLLSVFATSGPSGSSNQGPACGNGGCCNCSGFN